MKYNIFNLLFLILQFLIFANCNSNTNKQISKNGYNTLDSTVNEFVSELLIVDNKIITGAEQFNRYRHLLKDKKIAVVTNQTGIVDSIHLVDFLLSKKVNLIKG